MAKGIKGKFTKVGMVCLVLLLALGAIGVTYARWSDKPPKNDVVVWVGTFDDPFTWVVSNDDGVLENRGGYKPIDPGDDGLDPAEGQDPGAPLAPQDKYDKNVASTTANLTDPYNIDVTVSNAYPCYHSTVFFGMEGRGTIPGEIVDIIVDGDADTLDVTVSGIWLGRKIDPGEEVIGDVAIHVEQDAEQGETYTIGVTIVIAGWGVGGTPGFWHNWEQHYVQEQVNGWLNNVDEASGGVGDGWLVADIAEPYGEIDTDDLDAILKAGIGKGANEESRFLRHYLATRLNVEADRLFLDSTHDVTSISGYEYLGLSTPKEATLSEIFAAIESKWGTSPTDQEYNIMKRICEALNKVKI